MFNGSTAIASSPFRSWSSTCRPRAQPRPTSRRISLRLEQWLTHLRHNWSTAWL